MESCGVVGARHGCTRSFLADSEAFEFALFWMVVMKSQDYKFPESCGIVTMKES